MKDRNRWMHSYRNSRLQRETGAWLEREAESAEVIREAGREADAERALARVFRRLPLDRPSAGFADRVLVQAGVAALRTGTGLPAWMPLPLFRGLVAACLVLVGSLVVFLPGLVRVLTPRLGLSDWISGTIELASGAAHRLAEAMTVVEAVTGVGSTLADIILTPTWSVFLVVSLLVSAAATRALHDLIVPSRSV